MSQQLRDLRQRGAAAQQVTGHSVTQAVRPDPAVEPCPLSRGGHHLADPHRSQAVPGCSSDEEQRPARAARPAMLHVVRQSVPDVCGQRHRFNLIALATDDQLAATPVDIVELDGDCLRRPEAEACENHEHCIIAPSGRIGRPDRIE